MVDQAFERATQPHCEKHKVFWEACPSCNAARELALFKEDNARGCTVAVFTRPEDVKFCDHGYRLDHSCPHCNRRETTHATVPLSHSFVNCTHGVPLDLHCGACEAESRAAANPKDAVGSRKLSFSKMPKRALAEVALAFMDGAAKYGAMNWRSTPVRLTVYADAISRHVAALEDGQDCAVDGARLHHLAYIAAGAMVALDAQLNGRLIDDRSVNASDIDYMQKVNERAAAILDSYA